MKINHACSNTMILTQGFQLCGCLLPTSKDPRWLWVFLNISYVISVPLLAGTVLSFCPQSALLSSFLIYCS